MSDPLRAVRDILAAPDLTPTDAERVAGASIGRLLDCSWEDGRHIAARLRACTDRGEPAEELMRRLNPPR